MAEADFAQRILLVRVLVALVVLGALWMIFSPTANLVATPAGIQAGGQQAPAAEPSLPEGGPSGTPAPSPSPSPPPRPDDPRLQGTLVATIIRPNETQ